MDRRKEITMVLTVDQLYKLANVLMYDDYVINYYIDHQISCGTKERAVIICLMRCGKYKKELFNDTDSWNELDLCEENGRIFYRIYHMIHENVTPLKSINNRVLSEFELTSTGVKFVKEYLGI